MRCARVRLVQKPRELSPKVKKKVKKSTNATCEFRMNNKIRFNKWCRFENMGIGRLNHISPLIFLYRTSYVRKVTLIHKNEVVRKLFSILLYIVQQNTDNENKER